MVTPRVTARVTSVLATPPFLTTLSDYNAVLVARNKQETKLFTVNVLLAFSFSYRRTVSTFT